MSEEWTPTRISILIALWNEGLTTSVIGEKLGVTKNAVVGKVHRLGLPTRGSPITQKPKPAKVISLRELRPGMCSWPDGEPGKEDFSFVEIRLSPINPIVLIIVRGPMSKISGRKNPWPPKVRAPQLFRLS